MPMDRAKTLGSGRGPVQNLRLFGAAQDGNVTVFGMMLFMLMLTMGGLAVDLMRYETTRTTLQNTLDRATLAAASLTQELDGEEVVNDYFAKAGMTEYLKGVTVTEGLNFREVEADASAETNPFFTHLIGIEEMDAFGHSTAEQRVTNVEIALVLDVSGSMDGTKLANLKTAAINFVDTVLSSDGENRISIALVPYNGQVNLGAPLRASFNDLYAHGVANVNCIELPSAAFDTLGISVTAPLPVSSYADWSSSTNKTTSYVAFNDNSYGKPITTDDYDGPVCRPRPGNIVRLPDNNITELTLQINGLTATNYTSIMSGMKWGVAMLDPVMQPTFDTLAAAGEMPTEFDDRPYAWDDPESLKLIVLMTDGENTTHTVVTDAFKGGPSPIWKATSDGRYSIRHQTGRPTIAGANEYYVPHLGTWSATPFPSTAGAVQQDWTQVWAFTRQSWVAWQLYARALGTSNSSRNTMYNNTMNAMQDASVSSGTMNTQLQKACTQAKDKGVIVYGIAFEAPSGGQTQIKNCASSAAHYYNATGLQISSAFRSIANNISQLRLTQ
jgi:Flp pilus assembly protein TadG